MYLLKNIYSGFDMVILIFEKIKCIFEKNQKSMVKATYFLFTQNKYAAIREFLKIYFLPFL